MPVSLQSKLKEEEAPVRVNIKWKAPPIGWAKVNVNGAYVAATGKAGAGIIIRNHMGEVLLSSWRTIKNCGSAEEADQAVSCRDGIRLLVEWVKMPMILETDCANIGRAMVNTGDDRSPLWQVIREARAALSLIPEYRLQVARREANKAAHGLAQYARRTNQTVVWREHAPECVSVFIADDCNQT